MSENDQESINEQSYEKLLLGESGKKKRKPDPTKDKRWHAVKGLGTSINILKGKRNRAYLVYKIEPLLHVIQYYNLKINELQERKDDLIASILASRKQNG